MLPLTLSHLCLMGNMGCSISPSQKQLKAGQIFAQKKLWRERERGGGSGVEICKTLLYLEWGRKMLHLIATMYFIWNIVTVSVCLVNECVYTTAPAIHFHTKFILSGQIKCSMYIVWLQGIYIKWAIRVHNSIVVQYMHAFHSLTIGLHQ